MPRPKPRTASTPPDPRGDPRRGLHTARYSRYGVLSRPAGRGADRAALALALARQVAPPDPALHLPYLPLAYARPCRDRRLLRSPLHRPLPARALRLECRRSALDVAG